MSNISEFWQVWENAESWLVYANKLCIDQLTDNNWRTIFLDWHNKMKLVPACNFVIQLIEKKHYVANVLLAIWETCLHEKNHNYNPYRFSYKLAFSFFFFFVLSCPFFPLIVLSFCKRVRFSRSWWSGNEKHFCFEFIATCAQLQSYAEFNNHMPLVCNFIKNKTPTQVFSFEFCEIFKNTFFAELRNG